jgi:hypothetical protein
MTTHTLGAPIGTKLAFSKPYSIWFWQVEMSECICLARTVTETSVYITDVETVGETPEGVLVKKQAVKPLSSKRSFDTFP